MLTRFSWWLRKETEPDRLEELSSESIRFFLSYLRDAAPTAHWGGEAPNASRPARPSTVDTYFQRLRAFFNFPDIACAVCLTPAIEACQGLTNP